MDDKNFDDFLKSKFKDYEYPDVSSEALDAFHNRASSFQSMPWYAKYSTGIYVTASFILFTLLNGLIVWYGIKTNQNNLATIKGDVSTKVVDSLMLVINQLNSIQQKPSVFIINPTDNQNDKLKTDTRRQDYIKSNGSSLRSTNTKLYLGAVGSLPPDILDRLREEGVLETTDGDAYLLITDQVRQIRHRSYTIEPQSSLAVIDQRDTVFLTAAEVENKPVVAKEVNRISVKMVNQMADHQYRSGIGINLAPHLDLVKESFSQATGSLVPRVGLTAEWVVSPHWSVETSADYLTTRFTIHKDFNSFGLTGASTDLGELESVKISSRTLSVPINLKYRLWLTQKEQLVLKAGYTPYFYLQNQYVYKYPSPGRPPDSDLGISIVEQKDQSGYYGGTLNMALGISRFTKKKNQFEVSLFYEKSVGKVGQQKLGMQLFGVRTAYAFKLK